MSRVKFVGRPMRHPCDKRTILGAQALDWTTNHGGRGLGVGTLLRHSGGGSKIQDAFWNPIREC